MARRDLSGAVDFTVLERFTAGDAVVIDEVLALFQQQTDIWAGMLDPDHVGIRDAIHTIKGTAASIGAKALAAHCAAIEAAGTGRVSQAALDSLRNLMDAALMDVAAYRHQHQLNSLKAR